MSLEKSQTNEYYTLSFVSLEEIWKIRMCDIHPTVSHRWKFRIWIKCCYFNVQKQKVR